MKNIPKLTSIYLLVLVLCTAPSVMAVSFTADLVTTKKGKTETVNFYLLDSYYRMDVVEDGKHMVIIADKEKNVHRFLVMAEKVFFEIASDDFRILTNDPFKASEYMVSKYESKVEGDEEINGINCEKQVLTAQDKKIQSRWFSKELKFPVKLVSYEGDKEIYIAELRNIKKIDLQMDMFTPPVGFRQAEEPGAAEERKREELRKAEEALPGLTAVETTQVPCYVKIASGGELHVQMGTDRKASLRITNEARSESEFTISHYRNGKPIEGYMANTGKLEREGFPKRWDYNDEFAQKANLYLVDELRIKVEKGLVYAQMTQHGPDRTDSYNSGGQTDHGVDPKRPFTVHITGDNPFGDQTTGKFWLRYEKGGHSDAIPFRVETGKTRTWDYPSDKRVNTLAVSIHKRDGRAKISLVQPPYPKKPAPEQPTVKKAPKPKYTPKAKPVTQFTVTHPYGTGKPLTPGQDLVITMTGISGEASGKIYLYSDRKRTNKVDEFKFKLKKGQAESFAVPAEKNLEWATVWVDNGSFKVKLDQSPSAKAAPAPKTTQKPAAPAPPAAPTASNSTILNGRVPLMEGAKVLRTKTYGTNSRVDLEVQATPQEIVDFYKQAMAAKGWKPGMSMVQGNKGVLQLMGSGGQLIIKAKGQGQTSKVNMALMGQ